MITRRAIFEGRIKPGMEDRFFEEVESRLAPLWQAFPHALAVRMFRIEDCDDTERPVVMIQEVDYPDREKMQEAITSPARDAARACTMELLEMFDGRFYHVISGKNRLSAKG
ncbi:hypothetical protein [Aurantiacibacter odishensis]|uniref:hypothetical protein n=1 Tax=Aurantiacibacter odishensis TaxID=1155476 RepID=UPI000E768F26|nr:hypothetical protein [Aurantiacibacter odishensis]